MILSHAGGFLPYAAHRFTGAAMVDPGTTRDGLLADLRECLQTYGGPGSEVLGDVHRASAEKLFPRLAG